MKSASKVTLVCIGCDFNENQLLYIFQNFLNLLARVLQFQLPEIKFFEDLKINFKIWFILRYISIHYCKDCRHLNYKIH